MRTGKGRRRTLAVVTTVLLLSLGAGIAAYVQIRFQHGASAIDIGAELTGSSAYRSIIRQAVDLPAVSALESSPHMVFAHYFPSFPLSIDCKDPSVDYYQRNYLRPTGDSSTITMGATTYRNGGYLRDRPLPLTGSEISSCGSGALSQNDLEIEVRRAIADGIDGFTYDILSFRNDGSTQMLSRTIAMLAAINSVNQKDGTHFRFVMMPDMDSAANYAAIPEYGQNVYLHGPNGGADGTDALWLVHFIEAYANDPAVYHLPDGRLVVAPFEPDATQGRRNADGSYTRNVGPRFSGDWWQTQMDAFRADMGYGIALVAEFANSSWATVTGECAAAHSANGKCIPDVAYGLGRFSYVVPGDAAAARGFLTTNGGVWMASVNTQDSRPKSLQYQESNGPNRLIANWDTVKSEPADWVQIMTWNDYSESTEMSPSVATGYSFYDLNAYYVSRFKTGTAPEVARDALYYFHRVQRTDLSPGGTQATPFGIFPPSATPSNSIYAVSLLTAPATLSVTYAGTTRNQDVPAGLYVYATDLTPGGSGAPTFSLSRNGSTLGEVASAFPVESQADYPDLMYRGGSLLVPAVRIPLASAGTAGTLPATVTFTAADGTEVTQAIAPSGNALIIEGADTLKGLSDDAQYAVKIHPAGFLSQTVTAKNILSQTLPSPQASFVAGDFDKDDRITLGDIITAIRAYNGGTDDRARLANSAFNSPKLSLDDIIAVIHGYNAPLRP